VDWLTDALLAFVNDTNNPVGLSILGASAMIEYIFPPFPGDTITLGGAVLITSYHWSFIWVFAAVMAGSVVGSMADFYLGIRLERRSADKDPTERNQTVQRLVEKFRRHGALYLVINRFLPGIRALFFVAAGMAGMRAGPVLFFSAVSAALWNLAIIAVGSAVGLSFDNMDEWGARYSIAMWSVIGAVVLFFLIRTLLRRRRSKDEE
jgi:membrane protein DedA with SNARE-associated domain